MLVRNCSLLALLAVLMVVLPSTARADHRDRDDYRQIIRCESYDGRSRFCHADTRGGVRLIYQHSNSPCLAGRTWGWDRRGVWVTRGCRAEFALGGSDYGRGDYGGQGYDEPGYGGYAGGYGGVIRCESLDGRYTICRLGYGSRGVSFQRQLSRSYCQEGYSWGYRRDGVWVDHGCRAEFRVY